MLSLESPAESWRQAFAGPLLSWYQQNARLLPWRSDPTPYHVFVSEVMLQQTQVEPALPYYERFIRELPSLFELAEASPERLHKLWQGLGYYSRVLNMQKTAQLLCSSRGGEFPRTLREMVALPGIGEYTAGAILSIAFSLPVPAVDGNVLRVISRAALYREDIASPRAKREVGALIARFIPQERPGDFNQALMDLGATVCRPHAGPLCTQCPVRECCGAFAEGLTASLPIKAPGRERRREERTVLLVLSPAGVLLHRRPPGGLLGGLWEFPNLPGHQSAEQLGALLPKGMPLSALAPARHLFTHIEWQLTGFLARLFETPALPDAAEWCWADSRALMADYTVPRAFQSYLQLAQQLLEASP